MNKIKEIFQKFKSIKNFEIIVALIIIAVTLLIYFNVNDKKVENVKEDSTTSLTDDLEERLANILKEIDGVGEVSVMITFDSTVEQVTASNNNAQSTTTQNGVNSTTTSTQTASPIISNQNVIVLQEKMPEILGVIVVAEGAKDMKVKLNILSAVSTALDINQNSIQIYTRRDL